MATPIGGSDLNWRGSRYKKKGPMMAPEKKGNRSCPLRIALCTVECYPHRLDLRGFMDTLGASTLIMSTHNRLPSFFHRFYFLNRNIVYRTVFSLRLDDLDSIAILFG